MCDRGTPVRERVMCGCWTLRAAAAVAALVAVAAAAVWNAAAVLIVGAAAAAALVAFTAWQLRRNGGLWLVHRYTPPAAAEAEPQLAPVEVPWWERAQARSNEDTTHQAETTPRRSATP